MLRDESGQPVAPPKRDWAGEAAAEQAKREYRARVSLYAKGLAMSEIEIVALWRAAPKELERLVTEAGLHQRTPGRRAATMERLLSLGGPSSTPALCLTTEQEAARQAALAALRRDAEEQARKKADDQAEWDRFMAEHRRKAEQREAERSASPTAA